MSAASLLAPEEAEPLLGRAAWLDVRWALGRTDGHREYLAGHVPGAVYVDLETDLADPPGERGRHPLPHAERFGAVMRRCGVSADRPVVVYDDVSATSATRAWWLLCYFGHPDVRVLDGGWSWWGRTGLPVESGEPDPGDGRFFPSTPFVPRPGHLPVLDAADAARVAADGVLVDARAAERYRGEHEPVDPVAGHVPGAVNVPTAANLVPAGEARAGRFRGGEELAATYARAGVREGLETGVYCGSGVTATHDVFALHLLGREAALYAGSWSEWVTDGTRPVQTGA